MFPRPDGESWAWIERVRPLPVFTCEAVFRIETSVHVGPEEGMTTLEWETANVGLPPVDLPRQGADRATTAELLGREDALIRHYERIVGIAERHGKAASLRPFPCFRTQPSVGVGAEVLTEFAWNDDVHETRTVLEAMADGGTGMDRLLHDDQDQGWHILMAGRPAPRASSNGTPRNRFPTRAATASTRPSWRGRRARRSSACGSSTTAWYGRWGGTTGAASPDLRRCRTGTSAPPSAASGRAAGASEGAEAAARRPTVAIPGTAVSASRPAPLASRRRRVEARRMLHHGFGYHPGFGYHHAYGGGSWVGHVVVSSIIHGLIYGAIFRVLAHLSLTEIVLLAVVVIGGIYLWNRDRGMRRW